MNRPKIYLDTSVINFLFHDDTPEKKEATTDFFENYVKPGVYETFISQFVIEEITQTPSAEKRNRLLEAIANNYVQTVALTKTNEIEVLATEILKEGILPPAKLFDALHIAVSVIHEFDFLVSWNYKHLANISKERKVLALTFKMGYLRPIRIITPLELISNEN
jgi:predicted nucleic acid-binding protein